MNVVKMMQQIDDHVRFGNYELARNLVKRIDQVVKAVEKSPEKLGEEAGCCCPLRDRTEVGLTSCQCCWWETRRNLDREMIKLGMAP